MVERAVMVALRRTRQSRLERFKTFRLWRLWGVLLSHTYTKRHRSRRQATLRRNEWSRACFHKGLGFPCCSYQEGTSWVVSLTRTICFSIE